ncbi:MAG: type II secretion system F family protein [Defluviitaleaceae bacterium]|nr:type II secretion system F family protein [Defluviitaleaceae bacterium]
MEARKKNLLSSDLGEMLKRGRPKLSLRDTALFSRKISFMLDAGIPIKTALPALVESAGATSAKTRRAVGFVYSGVMQGESFARACESSGAFPDFACKLLAVGEKTAKLPRVAGQLADYYERRRKFNDELKAALAYPAAVTLLMIGVVALAVAFVLPEYARVFASAGARIPAPTRALMSAADFLSKNFFQMLLFASAAALGLATFSRFEAGRLFYSRVKLLFPIYRLKANGSIAQTLLLLLESGYSVTEAIPVCAESAQNEIIKRDLTVLSSGLSEGSPFWSALIEIKYVDPLFPEMARVGEETGRLAQSVKKCDEYYGYELTHAIKRLNKLIEPAITVALGFMLGAVMLAVILPAFSLTGVI